MLRGVRVGVGSLRRSMYEGGVRRVAFMLGVEGLFVYVVSCYNKELTCPTYSISRFLRQKGWP